MKDCIDLHIHTCKSDGTYTPTEVVEMAYNQNLKVNVYEKYL